MEDEKIIKLSDIEGRDMTAEPGVKQLGCCRLYSGNTIYDKDLRESEDDCAGWARSKKGDGVDGYGWAPGHGC